MILVLRSMGTVVAGTNFFQISNVARRPQNECTDTKNRRCVYLSKSFSVSLSAAASVSLCGRSHTLPSATCHADSLSMKPPLFEVCNLNHLRGSALSPRLSVVVFIERAIPWRPIERSDLLRNSHREGMSDIEDAYSSIQLALRSYNRKPYLSDWCDSDAPARHSRVSISAKV